MKDELFRHSVRENRVLGKFGNRRPIDLSRSMLKRRVNSFIASESN